MLHVLVVAPSCVVMLMESAGDTPVPPPSAGDGEGSSMKGICQKWHTKGYGFVLAQQRLEPQTQIHCMLLMSLVSVQIAPDNGGENLFVHCTQILDANMLKEGAVVSFTKKYDTRREKWIAIAVTSGNPEEAPVERGRPETATAPDSVTGPPPAGKERGVTKRWMNEHGFGFITPDDGGDDLFCHFSQIEDGNCLEVGSVVHFAKELEESKGKYRAIKVSGGVRLERDPGRQRRDGGPRDFVGEIQHSGGGDRRGGVPDDIRHGGAADRQYDDRRYDDRRYDDRLYDDRRYDDRRYDDRRYDDRYYADPRYDDRYYADRRYDARQHDDRYDARRYDERYYDERRPHEYNGGPRYEERRYEERDRYGKGGDYGGVRYDGHDGGVPMPGGRWYA